MEFLGNLKDFLRAVIDFTPATSIMLFRSEPPDTAEQLSKASFKHFFSWFDLSNYGGKRDLEEFITISPSSRIEEIQLITYPGTIRVANGDYVQNQMVTRKAFGVDIDFMPRKKQTGDPTLVIIGPEGIKRPCFNITEFLSPQLKEKIDAHNTELRRLQVPNNLSQQISIFVERDSVQTISNIRRTQPRTPRTGFATEVPINRASNIFEFPTISRANT